MALSICQKKYICQMYIYIYKNKTENIDMYSTFQDEGERVHSRRPAQ